MIKTIVAGAFAVYEHLCQLCGRVSVRLIFQQPQGQPWRYAKVFFDSQISECRTSKYGEVLLDLPRGTTILNGILMGPPAYPFVTELKKKTVVVTVGEEGAPSVAGSAKTGQAIVLLGTAVLDLPDRQNQALE